jgi:hypothetical protein
MSRRDRTYVTATELAAACEVDPKSIHNWVDRDQIPGAHRTPGRQIRVPAAQAVAFLKAQGYAVPDEFVRRAGVPPAPSAGQPVCPEPGCGYEANVRRYDADVARPLVLGSTRSHADEDAWRDMDGFDPDEELGRARRAVAAVRPYFSNTPGREATGHERWRSKPEGDPMTPVSVSEETLRALVFVAEAFDNIDERITRLGSAPKAWGGK